MNIHINLTASKNSGIKLAFLLQIHYLANTMYHVIHRKIRTDYMTPIILLGVNIIKKKL